MAATLPQRAWHFVCFGPSLMELVQLEHFVVLAEQLHFRRAAAVAGISASTLSRQINELEADIDARLFERNRRQVRLTPAGQAFLVDAQATLHRLRFAALDARRIGRGEQERLRIGHGDAVALEVLQLALPQLRTTHPDVRLQVSEATSAQLVEAVSSRELDIALVRPPVHHAGVEEEHVCDELVVAVLPGTHRLSGRRRLRVTELAGESLVVPPRAQSPGEYDLVMSTFAAAKVPPDVAEEASNTASLLLLVAAGLGVALAPVCATHHFDLGGIAVVSLAGSPALLPLHVVWRAGEEESAGAALRKAVGAAVGELASRPGSGVFSPDGPGRKAAAARRSG